MRIGTKLIMMLPALFAPVATAATSFTSVHPDLYDAITGTGTQPFTVGQSFSGIGLLASVTFHIDGSVAGSLPGGPTDRTYHAYVGEWDTSAGHLVAGSVAGLGTSDVTVPLGGNNVAVGFSFPNLVLAAEKTYMLFFSYGSGSLYTNVNLTDYGPVPDPENFMAMIPNPHTPDAFFGSGAAYFLGSAGHATTSSIESAYGTGTYSPMSANYDLRMDVVGQAVPEPGGALLSVAGLGALLAGRRRK